MQLLLRPVSKSSQHIYSHADCYCATVDQCAGQEVMVTEALRIGQDLVNITMPACRGSLPNLSPVDPAESLFARHQVEARELAKRSLAPDTSAVSATSPSECINPSICQCGQACEAPLLADTCCRFRPPEFGSFRLRNLLELQFYGSRSKSDRL